jgi:hypothetical protein
VTTRWACLTDLNRRIPRSLTHIATTDHSLPSPCPHRPPKPLRADHYGPALITPAAPRRPLYLQQSDIAR